jgi:D-glycero-alpha-D-manno-heptose-7-phosphate kinase
MLMIRSPLRITLGGGGTDLPSYANIYGGFCISAAISKYVYVGINRPYEEGIILKYSQVETASKASEIQHPIFREAIGMLHFKTPQLEIASIADVPSNGSGLGNSGAFTVALIKALYNHKNIPISQEEVAELACTLNMEKLGKTQGKQDEYISALGGIQHMTFSKDGTIVEPIELSHDTLLELEENLMLFYTGFKHDTESILNLQNTKTLQNDSDVLENLKATKNLGVISYLKLRNGYLEDFGNCLNDQWKLKEERMPEKNIFLHELHFALNNNGAIGNKIVGSGMGGFVLVYAHDKAQVRKFMKNKGLEELRFGFDFEGCKRIV